MARKKEHEVVHVDDNIGHHLKATLKSVDETQRKVSRIVNHRDETRERITQKDVQPRKQYTEIKQDAPKSYEAKVVRENPRERQPSQKLKDAPKYNRGNYQEPKSPASNPNTTYKQQETNTSPRYKDSKKYLENSSESSKRTNGLSKGTTTLKTEGQTQRLETQRKETKPRTEPKNEPRKNERKTERDRRDRREENQKPIAFVRRENTITQNTGAKPNKIELRSQEVKRQEAVQRLQSGRKETVQISSSNLQQKQQQKSNLDSQRNQSISTSRRDISPNKDRSPRMTPRSSSNSSNTTVRQIGTITQNTGQRPNQVKIRSEESRKVEVKNRIQTSKKESIGITKKVVGGIAVGTAVGVATQKGLDELNKSGVTKGTEGYKKGIETLKTGTSTTVTIGNGTDLKNLSKSMQTGDFQQKIDPKKTLQTRVESNGVQNLGTMVKGKFNEPNSMFVGAFQNTPEEISNIERMMSRAKFSGLFDDATKKEILTGLKNGTLSSQDVRNLLKSSYLANKNGIYIKDKNGKILSLKQTRVNGMANQFVGGKKAGIGKVSKGGTIGLKGASAAIGGAALVAKGAGSLVNAAASGMDVDPGNYVVKGVDKVKTKVKNKVKNKATGYAKKGAWKVTKKGSKLAYKGAKAGSKVALEVGKKAGVTLVRAAQATVKAIQTLVMKIVALVGGSSAVILIPVVLCIGVVAAMLSVFVGSDEAKSNVSSLFAAVQSEYDEQSNDLLNELRSKIRSAPGMGEFENITEEEYQSLISSQWKQDVVMEYGGSNIDFKAQMAMLQVLSGMADFEDPTVMSDIITLEKYWMDQGIVEKHSTSTNSNDYEVSWTAKKKVNASAKVTKKSMGAAETACRNKMLAYATNGYTIVNTEAINVSVKTNYKTKPIKDEDGKVIGHEEVVDSYTATSSAVLQLEKPMVKTLTQYIYSLHYENGRLDEYVELSQDAYKNDVSLTVKPLTLGTETTISDIQTDGTQEENMKAIWDYLRKAGYSEEATAGIMGNMWVESWETFDPKILQGKVSEDQFVFGQTGLGLCQWTDSGRQSALFEYADKTGRSRYDLDLQMDFLVKIEMPNHVWGYYFKDTEAFKKSKDIKKTTEAFMIMFERPSEQGPSYIQQRIGHSERIYNQLKGRKPNSNSSSSQSVNGRILWTGDSRTNGMQLAVNSGNNQWICKDSMGYNWFVSDAIPKVNAQLKEGDTIVFNFGVNDLGNVNKYISKLNALANGSWKKAKEIIVMSVNPVDEAKAKKNNYLVTNKDIETFNSKMKAGLNHDKLKYKDTYSAIKNDLDSTDGVHYSSTQYNAIYEMIRKGGSNDTSNDTVSYSTKISVSNSSKHLNKSFYYEELITQTTFDHLKPNNKANKEEISKESLDQINQLYESEDLLEGFGGINGSLGNSPGGTGGILEEGGVKIDFGLKYYTFSLDFSKGNPNVCDLNGVYYPHGVDDCINKSYNYQFNKMICSSYASGRYWEVNYPDDPYPLPVDWDAKLSLQHIPPGNGAYSRDPNNPIPKSIVSITWNGGAMIHDAFIEGVGKDGSVVISECNVQSPNQYGFKVGKYPSLQAWMNIYSPTATLNGMYGK